MNSYFIGVDAGTSVIKTVVLNSDGTFIKSSSVRNEYSILPGGKVEQDMAETWKSTVKTLQLLTDQIPNLAENTLAIAITGQGDGTWLIDAKGNPVSPAFLWLDSRSAEFVNYYTAQENYKEHFFSAGTGLSTCQQSSQLVWLKENQPEILKKAAYAFHCKDWLYYNLTGEAFTDPSESNFTFGNFRTRKYNPKLIEMLGLNDYRSLLPPILEGTTDSFPLSRSAANLIGLKQGTPIILGYVDAICSGLGSGLLNKNPESGCTILGSTGIHMRLFSDPEEIQLNSDLTGYTMVFPHEKSVVQIQSNMSATINIDWVMELLSKSSEKKITSFDTQKTLERLNEEIADFKPTGVIYHPYISEAGERGPFLNHTARSQFTGLNRNTNFARLLCSVYEGISYATRDCYALIGNIPKEIRLTGGISNSLPARKILANVLDAEIRTMQSTSSGATGAIMMAAVQQGVYSNMPDCAKKWVEPQLDEPLKPNPEFTEIYQHLFKIYREIRQQMPPTWQKLYRLRRKYNL